MFLVKTTILREFATLTFYNRSRNTPGIRNINVLQYLLQYIGNLQHKHFTLCPAQTLKGFDHVVQH